MDGMNNEEEVGNTGSENKSVSSECEIDWNCEDTEADIDDRNGEERETGVAK
jgi:hypothetical protein